MQFTLFFDNSRCTLLILLSLYQIDIITAERLSVRHQILLHCRMAFACMYVCMSMTTCMYCRSSKNLAPLIFGTLALLFGKGRHIYMLYME